SIVFVFSVIGLLGPVLLDVDSPNGYVAMPLLPPSSVHRFGTTTQGQDAFTQLAYGARTTFLAAAIRGGIAAVIAMAIGFTAGYRGGLVDEALNMLTNIVLVIPTLAVLLIINAYLGIRSVGMQALLIGLTSWPWAARAIRAQTFSLR